MGHPVLYMMFIVYVQGGARVDQHQFHFVMDHPSPMVDHLQSSWKQTTLNKLSPQQKEDICSRLKTRFGILNADQISRLMKTCNSASKIGTLASLASLMMGLAVFFVLK